MGYTNYWYHKKPFDNVEWNKIRKEYDYIVENFNDVIIKDESKDRDEIRFNGIGDNAHETFLIKKSNDRKPLYEGEDTTFDFCKTNRKPYDLAVWHMLTYIHHINDDKFSIKRDY